MTEADVAEQQNVGTTLAAQMHALMDQHGLTSISIGVNTLGEGGRYFTAYVHDDAVCASGHDHDGMPASAIGAALAELATKRAPRPDVAELVAA